MVRADVAETLVVDGTRNSVTSVIPDAKYRLQRRRSDSIPATLTFSAPHQGHV